jgi:hypothetical protein
MDDANAIAKECVHMPFVVMERFRDNGRVPSRSAFATKASSSTMPEVHDSWIEASPPRSVASEAPGWPALVVDSRPARRPAIHSS